MEENVSNINRNVNHPKAGLNTDNIPEEVKSGQLTYALNALTGSFQGDQLTMQNEEASVFCFEMPSGYRVIGTCNITQLSEVVYFLSNPTTGYSLVSYILNDSCVLQTLLDDSIPGSDLLGFNIGFPILKCEVKTTNCSTQIFFTDNFNPRRYIDLQTLPWKDTVIGGVVTPLVGQIDANKMLVQPNFQIPQIQPLDVAIGGNLTEGSYQFAACYSDVNSNRLTAFYSVTNPVRIFLDGKQSQNFNELTAYSIELQVANLDMSGLYSYFNLAAIKTINGITTVDLIGNFQITNPTFLHTYTGNEESFANVKLTLVDIMEQFPFYDTAEMLCQVDNQLVWAGLQREEDLSYQTIWNQVKVGWCTYKVPYTHQEGYHNGVTCANLQGYHRDEVYALEGCFLLANGKEVLRCHIPGRVSTAEDLTPVWNGDAQAIEEGTCPAEPLPRWKVYNTGSLSGFLGGSIDECTGIQPWQYGQMSYWESTQTYPVKPEVWGSLSGLPIRHHKFPDSAVTHIYDNNPNGFGTASYNNYTHNIFPIGFLIDVNSLQEAITNSTYLTQAQKNQIVGFKIMRSDRGAERSIVAKGLLFNNGQYTKEGNGYYYANYPFNDVRPDPFISSAVVQDKSGPNTGTLLQNFQENRFTFHSPDTHFYQPKGIEQSFLKLETGEMANAKIHFVRVEKNSGEKIRTLNAVYISLAAGLLSTLGINVQFNTTEGSEDTVTTVISPTFNMDNFFPTYNSMLDILDKLSPYYNYGWQYNGVGYYGNYIPIPNDNGYKIRYINYGGYILSGLYGTFGDDLPINNTYRESSVYVSTQGSLPFTHNQIDQFGNNLGIVQDNTRCTAQQAGVPFSSTPFYRNASSYYCSIKRYMPDQYGEIFSYLPVDTGIIGDFSVQQLPVFGGDVFINRFALKIKHSFFLKDTVGLPDGTGIDYNQDSLPSAPTVSYTNTGNIGYPIWYYSTTNKPYIMGALTHGAIVNLINNIQAQGLASGGGFGTIAAIFYYLFAFIPFTIIDLIQLMAGLFTDGFFTTLGLKVTNLDNYDGSDIFEKGQAYQYAYGIIYYFAESEVNVDMRQAINQWAGNFYPNVGTDIPDPWLQQINVPIAQDNYYIYNKSFSKQNKETFFGLLRPDWEPNQSCYINYGNRAIWSDKSDLEETKNNWLVYRPANLFDFPKSHGELVGLDTLENRSVLARFENRSQIYNALATVQTNSLTASLGTGALFSGSQPLDLSNTDTGYAGTQHKLLLSTEHGHIFADSKRGQIILLRGSQMEDLASAKYLNSKFFTKNLPFSILNAFPDIDIDNNYNGIGLHGVYDPFYQRLIITKLDYEPIVPNILFDGSNFYMDISTTSVPVPVMEDAQTCCPPGYSLDPNSNNPNGLGCYPNGGGDPIPCIDCGYLINVPDTPTCCPQGFEYINIEGDIFCWDPLLYTSVLPYTCPGAQNTSTYKKILNLNDPDYFCSKSFTVSFSFLTDSWISFHSYQPNFYLQYPNYFQAGMNSPTIGHLNGSIWDHNSCYSAFNEFFGQPFPYIIETSFQCKNYDELVQSVKDYSTALVYTGFDTFIEPKGTKYFNEVVVYNNQQNSGTRVLVPKDNNSLQQNYQYPQYNVEDISILLTKSQSYYQYNMIWDIVKDPDNDIWKVPCDTRYGNKVLDTSNLNFLQQSYKKYPIRGRNSKIRSTLLDTDFKLISRFVVVQTQNSIK